MIDIIIAATGERIGHYIGARTRAALEPTFQAYLNRATTLAQRKLRAFALVDSETQRRKLLGFTYDAKTFSLHDLALTQLIGLRVFAEDMTYPLVIGTIDELDEVSLVDAAAATAFALAGIAQAEAHRVGGRAAKRGVALAADEAAVDAAIDAWIYPA